MGIGLYDNEAGVYLPEPCKEHGQWYVDSQGILFVVPNDKYGAAEIDGPDGATLDALNAAYRDAEAAEIRFDDMEPETTAAHLELTYVYAAHKRFDPSIGYYVS